MWSAIRGVLRFSWLLNFWWPALSIRKRKQQYVVSVYEMNDTELLRQLPTKSRDQLPNLGYLHSVHLRYGFSSIFVYSLLWLFWLFTLTDNWYAYAHAFDLWKPSRHDEFPITSKHKQQCVPYATANNTNTIPRLVIRTIIKVPWNAGQSKAGL